MMRFDWHEEKSQANVRKHDVGFDEAATVFKDPLSLTIPDPQHSIGEDRFIDIGLSDDGRLLVVTYTEKGPIIRIISARVASTAERKAYEQQPN